MCVCFVHHRSGRLPLLKGLSHLLSFSSVTFAQVFSNLQLQSLLGFINCSFIFLKLRDNGFFPCRLFLSCHPLSKDLYTSCQTKLKRSSMFGALCPPGRLIMCLHSDPSAFSHLYILLFLSHSSLLYCEERCRSVSFPPQTGFVNMI